MAELQELLSSAQEVTTIEQANEILDEVDARASQALILSHTALMKAQKEKFPLQAVYVEDDEVKIAGLEQGWIVRGEK